MRFSSFGSSRILIAGLLVIILAIPSSLAAQTPPHSYPRTANYYLHWSLTPSAASALARWQVVVLDMENQVTNPALVRQIRQINPNVIILAYITPQEILRSASTSGSQLRAELAANLPEAWYLHDSRGARLGYWPGTYLFNVTNRGFEDYMSNFVATKITSSGLWDGVFYDNAWESVRWALPANDVDFDGDGVNDSTGDIDRAWRDGLTAIYSKTRTKVGVDFIIVGNGGTDAYAKSLNGGMLESFTGRDWAINMNRYRKNFVGPDEPRMNIINANTNNTGNQNDFQTMRFGLGSTLLEDGYYSFDYGNQDHGQLWRYDEYDVNLGKPLAVAVSRQGFANYKPDVWQRPFEHGVAVVNSSDKNQVVDLGGEYEKIHGAQDRVVNDGSIVSEVDLPAYDSLLLLKTFSSLNDTLFTNGSFARFFRPGGERVRNGFFVFESEYKGSDQIMHVDLGSNGERDLVLVSGNKIITRRDDGQPFFSVYPYGVAYAGNLNVAVGDLDGDGRKEIFVAPSAGYAGSIKVYALSGDEKKTDWYPFGRRYKGGFSLAVGQVGASGETRLVIGAGAKHEPTVSVYDTEFKLVRQWSAFEKIFQGGVHVATGNLDGAGSAEIIVGAGRGKKPIVKIFSEGGKEVYPSFTAYSTFDTPGIGVAALDVDFDGRDDIVGFSTGI